MDRAVDNTRKISIRRVLALMMICVLMLGCVSFSARASAPTQKVLAKDVTDELPVKKDQTDKAGYKDTITIINRDKALSLPTYFEPTEEDDDQYLAYVDDGDFAMFMAGFMDNAADFDLKNESYRKIYLESMLSSIGDATLSNSDYVTIGTTEGMYAEFVTTSNGYNVDGTLFCFVDKDTAFNYVIMEMVGNKYDYRPDFIRTMVTIHKASASELLFKGKSVKEKKDNSKTEANGESKAGSVLDNKTDDLAGYSMEEKNAIKDAKKYIEFMPHSRKGLIDQLSSEYGSGYTLEAATKAVEYLEENNLVDWKEQAVRSAKLYLEYSSYSKQGLIDMLSSEYGAQYTKEEAEYAAKEVGY